MFAMLLLVLSCKTEIEELKSMKPKVNSRERRIGALPENIPFPKENPITDEKVHLGRLLFFDPILSGKKDVSCATCHHPSTGYAENRALSIGVNGSGLGSRRVFNQPNDIPFLKRNSQTVLNTAFNGMSMSKSYDATTSAMFWDLRAESLEKQALEPIKAFEEMRGHDFDEEEILAEVVGRLTAIPEYREKFKNAFGSEAIISEELLGKAIASFERTLVTNNSRFDQYMRGDEDAISLSEKDGLFLFKSAGCDNCHNGPMFSDYKILVLGVPENTVDAVGMPIDKGFEDGNGFRTPSLRNLNVTGPYMHNGSLTSLLRVLEFYEDISGSKLRNPRVKREEMDPLIDKISLTVPDMRPIISFLNCLNDNDYDQSIPESVPSGLKVGGN